MKWISFALFILFSSAWLAPEMAHGQSYTRVDAWRPPPLLSVSGCNYTHATKKITKTSGFTNYAWQSGDVATFSAGYRTSSIFFLLNSNTITGASANDITLQDALTFVGGAAGDISNNSITVNICRSYYRFDVDARGSKAAHTDPIWAIWTGGQGGNIMTTYIDNTGSFYTGAAMVLNPVFSQYTEGGASGVDFRYPQPSISTILYVGNDIDGPNVVLKGNTNPNCYLMAGWDSSENYVFSIEDTGALQWGIGSTKGSMDTTLSRSGAGELTTQNLVTTGTVLAQGGYKTDETGGTAKVSGVVTLAAGTKVVSTTAVTNNTRIVLTVQNLGTVTTPKAIAVTARTSGASFTITSSDNTDTSRVYWELHEPLLETDVKPTSPVWNASHPLGTGMVCAYLFTEGSGTSCADATGQMSAATMSGTISWSTDTFGPLLYFNGSLGINQCLAIPSLSGKFASNEGSCLYYIKMTTQNPGNWSDGLVSSWLDQDIFPSTTNDAVRFSTFRAGGAGYTGSSLTYTRTSWHRLLITSKSGANNYKVYLNGTQIYQNTGAATISIPTNLKLGEGGDGSAACNNSGFHANMRLGTYILWNRALSSTEATDLESDVWAAFR